MALMTAVELRANAVIRRISGPRPKVVEVGVLLGKMSEAMLRANANLELWMVDSWAPGDEQPDRYKVTGDAHSNHELKRVLDHKAQAVNRARHFPNRAHIVHATSMEAATKIKDASMDLVFLDADHSYEGVKEDIEAWQHKVKPGGWIGGHDYLNPEPGFDFSGVEAAVDEWAYGRLIETDDNCTWFHRFGADRVLIVATGPSVEEVRIPKLQGVHVIAVNDAIRWLPRADSWFSMDVGGPRVRELASNPEIGTRYYMAAPDSHQERLPNVTYLRRVMGDGVRGTKHKLATLPNEIHAGNSTGGAMNLAFHMRPRKIGILGLDATDVGHAYSSHDPAWSLGHLPELFESYLPQLKKAGIQVRNGSPRSNVTCFTRQTQQEVIEWLMS